MSKRTLLLLAVAMSFATVTAANPFADVPSNHWAYDSVEKLSKIGVIEGYEDGNFRGDRVMTRYEMAQIIARALSKIPTVTTGGDNAALKAELDKLSVEFAKELKSLGVRVAALEKQDSSNVKFSGDTRIRYRHYEDGLWSTSASVPITEGVKMKQDMRVRLKTEGKVNENWTVVARFLGTNDLRSSSDTITMRMDLAHIQGKYGNFTTRIGRYYFGPAGNINDDYTDGAELTYSNKKFYTSLYYGRFDESFSYTNYVKSGNTWSPDYKASAKMKDFISLEAGIKELLPGLRLRGHYTHLRHTATTTDYRTGVTKSGNISGGIWEIIADYKVGKSDFKVKAGLGDSTGDLNMRGMRTAWFAQVDYKETRLAKPGTWMVYAGYQDYQKNLVSRVMVTALNNNGKGWYVGAKYVPAKNILLSVAYEDMKPWYIIGSTDATKGNAAAKHYFRINAEMFF